MSGRILSAFAVNAAPLTSLSITLLVSKSPGEVVQGDRRMRACMRRVDLALEDGGAEGFGGVAGADQTAERCVEPVCQ